MRTLVLSIDLDSPSEYAAIHGLQLIAEDPHLMYRTPLWRFVHFCQKLGAPATLFAISRDVCGVAASTLVRLSQSGFEIASHSHAHDYQQTRRQRGDVERDIRFSKYTFKSECGLNPLGYRAPGYQLSAALLDMLESEGFLYDASVLPSYSYYGAKALALWAHALAEKPSVALLGPLQQIVAPKQPHRPGTLPYTLGNRHLAELPVSVATPLALPLTGQFIACMPTWLRRTCLRGLERDAHVMLNFHGIDFADSSELPASIVAHQPELRVPLERRLHIYYEFCTALLQDRQLCTAEQLARAFLSGREIAPAA